MLKSYFIIGIVVLLTGIGIGVSVTSNDHAATNEEDAELIAMTRAAVNDTAPPVSNEPSHLAQEIALLKQRLAAEVRAREKLESKIVQLALQARSKSSDEKDSEDTNTTTSDAAPADANHNPQNGLTQKQQALVNLGLDTGAMERIKRREEQQEMSELYLRDRATREGWFGTERYFQEARKLDQQGNVYRQELGDARYDKYLYDSEQNNRVGVLSVLSGSPAENAGLKNGDVIVAYDNERVFNWSDLTTATSKGTPGQTVRVDIKRDEQSLSIYVPRGPLGIRLNSMRQDPAS